MVKRKSDTWKGAFVAKGQKENKMYREYKVNKSKEEKSWPKEGQKKNVNEINKELRNSLHIK